MFEYKGNQYTLQDLQNAFAGQQDYVSFDEFMQVHLDDGMKEIKVDARNLSQEERQRLSDEMYSIKERRTASGDVVKGSTGAVYAKNIANIITSLITDPKERKETVEVLSNVPPEVKRRTFNYFAYEIPNLIRQANKSIRYDGLYDEEELKYLKTLDPNATYEEPSGDPTGFKTNADRIKYLEGYKSSSAGLAEQKANEKIVETIKKIESSDKYLRKDTGEGIVKGIKQGDASDVIGGIFNASASMVETVVPAMLTYGISIPFQITAPMVTDYNQRKAENIYGKDDPDAIKKLFDNRQDELAVPAVLGLIGSSFEYIGFKGIQNYILNKGAKNTVGKLMLTGNREGFTEIGQSGVEEINLAKADGKDGLDLAKAFIDGVYSEKGIEAYLNGFIGGATMSAGGSMINRALRSDKASVKELNGLVNNLAELNVAKNTAINPTAKEAIEVEIKEAEKALKNYITDKRKIADILNEDQKQDLINAINEKDNIASKVQSLKNQLNKNEIGANEFNLAIRSLNNQDKRLTEQIETINEAAKQQLLVTGLETAKEEGETVGLEQKLFETKEEYAALFGEKGSKEYNEALKADGHISEDGNTYFVNMETARETGAIAVGSHELLHGIIGDSFNKLSPEAKRKLNKNFLNLLSKKDKQTVLDRLASAYGITGNKVFTTEELYTAFSDVIIDGDVKFNEGVFGKIKNAFEETLRQLSSAGYFSKESFLYRKEFGNARQAYNFVKDYSLTIKKTGKLTQRAKEFAKEDPIVTKEKPRYSDDTVPVKRETFTQTMSDGTKVKYRAITRLDGSVYFQSIVQGESNFTAASKKLNIKADDNITPKQRLEVIDTDATITLDKTEDYKSVMNPKMFDRLTSDQQQKVDPKRAKQTKKSVSVKKSVTPRRDLTPAQSTKLINDLGKQIVDEDGTVINLEEKGIGNTYFEVEADNIYKKIQEQGLLDNLILKQPHVGVNDKTFLDTTYAELFSWFKKYQPERKNPSGLFGHINPQIPNRATQAYNAITKGQVTAPTVDIGQTTKEGEVKVQVAAETDAATKAFEREDISPAAQARKKAEKAKAEIQKKSEFRRAIGIETDSKIYNEILDGARKALLRAYEAGTSVRNIQRKLRDEANVYLFKTVKNFLGNKNYISNLKKFREPIMRVMFTSDLVQLERNVPQDERVFTRFVRKLTSKQEVQDAVDQKLLPPESLNIIDKGTAVNLYEKANPTEAQFMSFFDIPAFNPVTKKRSGKRGTRKDQLAKYMTGALAYDATMQVAQEPDVMQQRADLAELKGETLAKDNLQVLAAEIGRNPNIKFSISTEQVNQGVDIIEGKNKNDGFGGKNWQKYYDNKKISNETKWAAQEEYLNRLTEENDAISQEELSKLDFTDPKRDGSYTGKRRKKKFATYKKYEIIAKQRAEKILSNLGLDKQGYKVENLSEKDNNPDIRITRKGKTVFTIEIKGNTARGVSVSFNYKQDSKKLVKGKKAAEKQETENYNKQEEALIKFANPIFEKMIKLVGPSEFTYSRFKNLQISVEGYNKIIEKGLQLEIHGKQFFITTSDFANSYAQKKGKDGSSRTSNAIDIGNAGMFLMDSNSIMQVDGLKNFSDQKVLIPLTARINFNKNKAKTHYTVSIRVEPQINSLFFEKQDVSLINKSGNKNFKVKKSVTKDVSTGTNLFKASRSDMSKSNGASIFDFDETVGVSENFVIAKKGDIIEKIPSYEWPLVGETLKEQGYEFDFTDFNKVTKGKPGPLLPKMKNQIEKYGSKNVFILTARAPESAVAIHEWLQSEGVNIPLENVTGLGDSTGEAKATWILDKYSEKGYNDIYFVDDALQNVKAVKNMFDQLDIKGKSVQAKVKFSKSMNNDFNKILEEVTGIDAKKRFSDIKARKRGEKKGKFRLFIPPSHEDFVGLLYNFMGKGRQGDQHRNFFEQALVKPLNRAYREIDTAKQAIANDYKSLNKQFPDIKKKLKKKTPDGDFTFEDAIRVYLWNKHGYEISGLSKTDQANLSELVMEDSQLQAYAETLDVISKQDTYVEPGKGWEGGNIQTDLIDATGRVGRAKYFKEFKENADILFSEENLNKIEAGYGKDFRSALEDMLHRISTGVNRPKGQHATTNKFMNYLNGSVGTVMFFNVRSAILQQMSIVNYINFADNNIFAAAKAFANQKQYWADFAFIFNSDMLKQRRGGIGTDINGADLAQAVAGSKNPSKMVISYLLKIGFLPTQIGDNIAIATGGATFYRNRVNKYIKDGMSQKEAEAAAFTDFQDLTQSTQQSSRPDMTSQQQASWIGKLVLNFQNITSQYNRIIKKAALDIGKGRISPPYTSRTQSNLGNLSKILYYGGIQNVLFYSLQTALFAVMFDDDKDEDQILKKKERVINGTIDSILRGSGIYGAAVSTLKNMIIKFKEQREKGYNKDESAVLMELLNFSPVVGIKSRMVVNAEKTINYNENVISEMETFDADNPQWSAVTNYTQALTNFPANRLYQKSINMRNALDKDYTNFQRIMFFSGYTTWSLGLGDPESVIEAKEKIKINKKNTKKKKKKKSKTFKILK